MKSEDITALATSTIAVTLLLGTFFYFQKESEKKRLREDKIEEIQMKIKKKNTSDTFNKDRDTCKVYFDDELGFTRCMKTKGWSKRLFN